MGTWPHHVLVMDERKEAVVDRIELKTGVPFGLMLSFDKKKLYATTIERSGIETIDLATRKVVDSFVLDSGNRKERLAAYAIDKDGKYLYSIVAPTVKKIDRFDIEQAQFITVDLAQHKIVRRVDYPKDLDVYGVTGLVRQLRRRDFAFPRTASSYTCSARTSWCSTPPISNWWTRSNSPNRRLPEWTMFRSTWWTTPTGIPTWWFRCSFPPIRSSTSRPLGWLP